MRNSRNTFAAAAAAMSGRSVGRVRTGDILTFDNARGRSSNGDDLGRPLGFTIQTHDGRTVDSTGAFLLSELERLDQTLHMPLASVNYGRDIDMREDITIADEASSFTLSTFAAPGGLGMGTGPAGGKSWIGKTTDEITGISLDIGKKIQPLRLWGMELKYTIPELESAAKLGRPIDQQKFEGLNLKHQMDIDAQVYYGDSETGDTGLVNNVRVTNVASVANGAVSGTPAWGTKTPDDILADFNEVLTSAWAASGYAEMPNTVLLPPTQFGYISTQKVSQAGNVSILKYILDNNVLTTSGLGKLSVYPTKWLVGAGAGGTLGDKTTTNRMVAYVKRVTMVRYPMTSLQRTPLQYESIWQKTTYYCRLGVVEYVYPETAAYRDGI